MYIGEPFSWKPAAFEGSNGIMSVTTKETTAHGRGVYAYRRRCVGGNRAWIGSLCRWLGLDSRK